MIKTMKEIPVTEQSCPFSTAKDYCRMDEQGYVEKEYLFAGTSNVYHTAENGQVEIEYADVPYTNNLIVRCPADPEKFSGHVVVEITNATAKWNIERMWIISQRYFMRHGIAYIGITSKPDVFDSLKRYDESRYGSLDWPNPRPESERVLPDPESDRLTFLLGDQECGLFWDMLSDLADLLRRDVDLNPLQAYRPKYVSLTGWSQSSCYLTRYVNTFAYRNREADRPVYDGYLAAGGVYILGIPVNQNEYDRPENMLDCFIHHMEQPLVIVQTESEGGSFGNDRVPRFNSEEPGNLCRLVEIAGATHDTKQTIVDYYAGDEKMLKGTCLAAYLGEHPYPNDFPYDYPINAAYDHLFRWVETGEAPAVVPRMEWTAAGVPATDAFGNAVGGVRTAFVDLPTCRYVPWSIEKGRKNVLFGHVELFSPEFLQELYGSLSAYEKRVREVTAKHVAKGYVLKEEEELLVEEAVKLARERGLQ